MDPELKTIFVEEVRENAALLDNHLLELEQQGAGFDEELMNLVFRKVHSIKGAAGSYGYKKLSDLSHAMETVLDKFRKRQLTPDSQNIDALLEGYRQMSAMIDDLDNSESAKIGANVTRLQRFSAPPGSSETPDPDGPDHDEETPPTPPVGDKSYALLIDLKSALAGKTARQVLDGLLSKGVISYASLELSRIKHIDIGAFDEFDPGVLKVSLEYKTQLGLDDVKAVAGAALVNGSCERIDGPAETGAKETGQKKDDQNANEDFQQKSVSTLKVSIGVLDNLMNLTSELIMKRNQLSQMLADTTDRRLMETVEAIRAVTSQMQENVMKTRLQPIKNLFNQFPVIIRQISREKEKKVSFLQEGGNVELDRALFEAMFDPLLHIVRNCIDHGIEMPDERLAAGKEETGFIFFKAYSEAGQVTLEVHDDGRGIDAVKVREKAIAKGLITQEEAERLSEADIINFVFTPGFSTAEKISDTSGRGVGMDVVLSNFKNIGGSVSLETRPGAGTIVKMKIPLTLLILQAIIVETADRKFVIPEADVLEIVRLKDNSKIDQVYNNEVFELRDELIPIVRLSSLLKLKETAKLKTNEGTAEEIDDRRSLVDRRNEERLINRLKGGGSLDGPVLEKRRTSTDRRSVQSRALNILILHVNRHKFGLVVNHIETIEEVVVKPLGSYFNMIKCYSGVAAIGDANLALILDAGNLAAMAHFNFTQIQNTRERIKQKPADTAARETTKCLLFRVGTARNDIFAVPIAEIDHIIKARKNKIGRIGKRNVVNYLDHSLPLIYLDRIMPVEKLEEEGTLFVAFLKRQDGPKAGIICKDVIGIMNLEVDYDSEGLKYDGILGTKLVDDRIIQFLDVDRVRTLVDLGPEAVNA